MTVLNSCLLYLCVCAGFRRLVLLRNVKFIQKWIVCVNSQFCICHMATLSPNGIVISNKTAQKFPRKQKKDSSYFSLHSASRRVAVWCAKDERSWGCDCRWVWDDLLDNLATVNELGSTVNHYILNIFLSFLVTARIQKDYATVFGIKMELFILTISNRANLSKKYTWPTWY